MIKISENTVGIWFLGYGTDDLLLHLDRAGDSYKLTYRFRYYKDDKAFDSEDDKHWYEGMITDEETDESVIKHLRAVVAMALKTRKPDEFHELLMEDKTMDEFMEAFLELPFVNVQKLDKEEAEEKYPELRVH